MTRQIERDDSDIPAGYTYFGQFIDHDITHDGTPGLPVDAPQTLSADQIQQLRSPSLDLDSLYGDDHTSGQFTDADGLRLRLGATTPSPQTSPTPPFGPGNDQIFAGHDVPRDASGKAIIGDERNDENLIVQQIHTLFIRFHNKVALGLRAHTDPVVSNTIVFAQARGLVTQTYQWIVLNDFVRRLVDPAVFAEIIGVSDLTGVSEIQPRPLVFNATAMETPPMPLEFSGAAFRMGHSMVRDGYSWNRIFFDPKTAFALFFRFTQLSGSIGAGSTFPSNWVADWRRMFPLEEAGITVDRAAIPLNHAKRIDTSLTQALGVLPKGGGNLAARNLIRGSRNGLPSGQDVAAEIVRSGDAKATPLSPADILGGLSPDMGRVVLDSEFHLKTPLWFYILREAEVQANGAHLGRVGSRIVVETFLQLIRSSVTSIFTASAQTPGALRLFDPASTGLNASDGTPLTSLSRLIAFTGEFNPLGDL